MKLCPEQVPSPAEPPTPEIDKIFSKSSSVPTTVQIDPMSLLEPTYFEENTGPIEVPNKNSHPPVIKKQTVKKAKKRKFLENERVSNGKTYIFINVNKNYELCLKINQCGIGCLSFHKHYAQSVTNVQFFGFR